MYGILTRRRCHSLRCAVSGAVFSLLGWAAPVAATETLTITGAGSGLGTMQLLAAGFGKLAPAVNVVVVPRLGNDGGLRALNAGAVDATVISRPLKPHELNRGLVVAEYGKTPFCFITRTPGAIGFSSLEELTSVYAGIRQTWPDGTMIRLIMRPAISDETKLIASFSPAMKQAVEAALARPGMIIETDHDDAATALNRIPGALGANSLATVISERRQVSMLPFKGVMPSVQTIADGSYPFVRTMLLVRKPAAREIVLRFFAFVASPQGRQILLDSGHWVQPAP